METISRIARVIERLVGYVFAYLTGYSRAESEQERDNREAVERIREREGDIREAENQARKEAAENAEDIEDSRRRGERDRGLDNDRL